MKRLVSGLALIVAVAMAGSTLAEKPVNNVSGKKHPNLAAAQHHSSMAYEKIVAAQKANEWDMNGHAQKAKELLEQVNVELKAAAQAANQNAPK